MRERLSTLGMNGMAALLAAQTGMAKAGERHVPVSISMEKAKAMGLDLKVVDEMAEFKGMGGISVTSAGEMLDNIEKKFKNKEPIFRDAAKFREATASIFDGIPVPSWFSELVDMPEYLAITKLRHAWDLDLHSTLMSWVVMKFRSVSSTSNWFKPSEGLAYKLAATDLVGATCGDLKLPMDAFYIELPEKFLYIEDAKTGWHEVRSVTVSRGEITQRTLEVAKKHEAEPDSVTDALLGPRLLVECYAEPNDRSTSPFDDSWLFMTYKVLADDKDMDAVLGASLNLSNIEMMQNGRIGEKVFDGRELRIFLLKFVLNFCVYLGSEKATKQHVHAEEIERLVGGKKRKNLRKNVQERIRRLEDDKVFEVGTDIEVDLEMKEIIQTEGTGAYRLTYRTLVRGHWRSQAHGPGWTLRRRKWIEPHVRGQDLPTKVVGHTYSVD